MYTPNLMREAPLLAQGVHITQKDGPVPSLIEASQDNTPTPNVIPGVRAYWEALRPHNSLPMRQQINPRGMAHALEHIFLLERATQEQAADLAYFRIAGMMMGNLAGTSLEGAPFSRFFSQGARIPLRAMIKTMFNMPAILKLELSHESAPDKALIRMEVMPLLGQGNHVNQALGVIEHIDAAPQRHTFQPSLTSMRCKPINASNLPTPEIEPRMRPRRPPPYQPTALKDYTLASQPPRPPRAKPGTSHLKCVK